MTERERLQRNRASRKWQDNNPERVRQAYQRWYENGGAEKRRIYRQRHRNPNRIDRRRSNTLPTRQWQKEYDRLRYLLPENVAKREALKDKKRAYMSKWNRDNRDKHQAAWHKRKAQKRGNGIGDTKIISNWIRRWRTSKSLACYWCKNLVIGTQAHVDHIIALNKGGLHSIENLCVSCRRCNQAKHDKSLSIWNQQIVDPVLL